MSFRDGKLNREDFETECDLHYPGESSRAKARAALLHLELTHSIAMNVTVDMTQVPLRGRTICDRRPEVFDIYESRIGRKCTVLLKVDLQEMVKLWIERIK
jgi:hypothetical protein